MERERTSMVLLSLGVLCFGDAWFDHTSRNSWCVENYWSFYADWVRPWASLHLLLHEATLVGVVLRLYYGWSVGMGSGFILLWKPIVIKEYVWFLLPIAGLLWQLGGTFHKDWRRIVLPCTIFICCLLFGSSLLSSLLESILLGIVVRLPFTIGGDSIRRWWQFLWLFLLGAIFGCPALFLQASLSAILVPCVVVGTLSTLSNTPQTAKWFPWKFCEFCFGASVAYPFCLALSSNTVH